MTPRDIEVRLARSPGELDAAQRLRFQVFYEEWGATGNALAQATRRDSDRFDDVMDHLVVIDHRRPARLGKVVGNYRLLRLDDPVAEHFYTSTEFDISGLVGSGQRLLELGRSCVLREYRSLPVLQMLWRAIAGYVADHRIEMMFGCASLHGTDPHAVRQQLAYLHHYHAAPAAIRPVALASSRVSMDVVDVADIDPRVVRATLEPIIKGYLRLGAGVGAGAFLDHDFNAVDVCIVLPTAALTRKYQRHYERTLQRPLAGTHSLIRVDDPHVTSDADAA